MAATPRSWASALVALVAVGGLGGLALTGGPSSTDGDAATSAQPPAVATASPAPAPVRDLSRPGSTSRWAFVAERARVRTDPDYAAKTLGTLGTRTGDGTDELVLVLQETRGTDGRAWVRVRTPLLPTGTVGWVPRDDLTRYQRVHTWVVVDRAARRLGVLRRGRLVFRADIGIGKPGTPTPAGSFYIRSRLLELGGTAYGPAALGTSARSTHVTDWPGERIVGIHGTDQPQLLPGRVSHGCVRMRNADVLRLVRLAPIGTPVTVV